MSKKKKKTNSKVGCQPFAVKGNKLYLVVLCWSRSCFLCKMDSIRREICCAFSQEPLAVWLCRVRWQTDRDNFGLAVALFSHTDQQTRGHYHSVHLSSFCLGSSFYISEHGNLWKYQTPYVLSVVSDTNQLSSMCSNRCLVTVFPRMTGAGLRHAQWACRATVVPHDTHFRVTP